MLLILCGVSSATLAVDQSPSLPRTAWGDPVLSGIVNVMPHNDINPRGLGYDIVNGFAQSQLDYIARSQGAAAIQGFKIKTNAVETPDGQVPYQPWAKAKQKERQERYLDPPSVEFMPTAQRCLSGGVRLHRIAGNILQFPGYILMLWEHGTERRIIWTDGRPPPDPSIKLWMGFSTGHWQGDTLIVTTTNNNGFPWMDQVGNFFSENARFTETFQPVGTQFIDYRIVHEDPTVYTQPWALAFRLKVTPFRAPPPAASDALEKISETTGVVAPAGGEEILETACVEGNREYAIEKFKKT